MDMKKNVYRNINEEMYIFQHESGLKAFVIPKEGYSKKYAAFAVNFGSINNRFKLADDEKTISVPDGVAHFLEHKLFEQKEGSVMDKFSELGASPNAYTGFNQTVYLFSCTDMFDECFSLLLNFVQNPHITEESVEKEKSIITQEIKMYQDNAEWRVFFNLLKGLYKDNAVKIDIAGTPESINQINSDILYRCYNTFYHPSNMIICVAGDVTPEEVFEQIDKSIKNHKDKPEIIRIFPEKQDNINNNYVSENLAISTPLFQMGYKDNGAANMGLKCMKREIAMKILLEIIMGRSSNLYNELYNEGLINRTFEADYMINHGYAFSIFGGESKDPIKVKEKIIEAIGNIYNNGIDKSHYERIKKAMNGRFIRQFNSVERISHIFISVYFKEVNIFDYLDVYDKISFEYINNVFKEHFVVENLVLSVVNPE